MRATAGSLAAAPFFLLVACTPLNAATLPDLQASCGGVCMKHRVVLITNATSGVGRETARALRGMGAEVIVPGADLSSLEAARRLAADVKQRWGRLDVLIHVGLSSGPVFETNHLAPFLLTNLLLPELMKGSEPRVVLVAAPAYTAKPIDFDDPTSARDPDLALPRAKAANILFMRELAARTAGTGLTVNALHAGFGNMLHLGLVDEDFFDGPEPSLAEWIAYPFAEDEVAARVGAVYLAASPEVAGVTGTYFVEGVPHEPKPFAKDPQLRQRLWELSARLVNLTP